MFIRKLAVASAFVLCAVSAFGSNFRAADQVYIPVAGHTTGSSGTFISDVFISNLSDDRVQVSIIYTPIGGTAAQAPQEFRNVITLAPRERRDIIDFFPTILPSNPTGFGQLIFNACLENADCGEGTQDELGFSPFFRNIAVSSRIYSIPPGATLQDNPPPLTTGQFLAGIPWYSFVSSLQEANGLHTVFIHGLRATGGTNTRGTYRSNIGLVNASQYSTTDFIVRLFNGTTGAQIGSDFRADDIAPLGNVLLGLTNMFSAASGNNLFVTVQQTDVKKIATAPPSCSDGCPAFLAYGSVLDNGSGDATTLEAVYQKVLTQEQIGCLYPNGSGKTLQRRSAKH